MTVALRPDGDSLQLGLSWQPEVPAEIAVRPLLATKPSMASPDPRPSPDGARRQRTVELPAMFCRPASYLVESTVRDPWLPDDASKPPPSDAQMRLLVFGDLRGRLRQLEMEAERTGGCFSCRCQQLLIRRLLGDPQAAEQDSTVVLRAHPGGHGGTDDGVDAGVRESPDRQSHPVQASQQRADAADA